MCPRLPLGRTIVKLFQVTCRHRFQLANQFGVHAKLTDLHNINPAQ
jgi:hypothetical protein